MNTFRLSFIIWGLLTAFSCSQEKKLLDLPNNEGVLISEDEIIFESAEIKPPKHRGEDTRLSRSLPIDNAQDWLVDENELKELGHSYWFNGEDLIERELKKPVVNIRTLVQDPLLEGSVSITSHPKVEIQTQAFRDILHTRTENSRYNKISGGFKFNLFNLVKLFDFSSSYEKKFYNQYKYFNTSILGESNVLVYGKSVSLSNGIEVRSGIIERHLYPNFIRSLYNSPIGEISKSYGPLVLCKYRLGGKLNAKYLYNKSESEALDSIYQEFKTDLDVTFNPIKKEDRSAGVHYNYSNFERLLHQDKHQKLYVTISTIGGAPELQINLPVLESKDLPQGIDVSAWVRSLTNEKTHTIIDIQDDGLVPISEFILESNFRQRIMDTYSGILEPNMKNDPVRIEISKVFIRYDKSSGEPLCDIALVLHTRNGDKLILTKLNENASDEELTSNNLREQYISKGRNLVATVKDIFKGIKKSGKPNKILYPYLRTTLCSHAVIDFNRVRKYKNPKTKVVYLYDDTSKIALSYYQGEDGDKDLESEYGLTDFVKTLPEKEISIMNLLQNYKILGL